MPSSWRYLEATATATVGACLQVLHIEQSQIALQVSAIFASKSVIGGSAFTSIRSEYRHPVKHDLGKEVAQTQAMELAPANRFPIMSVAPCIAELS